MTDRVVTVGDDLTLPASVKVPAAQVNGTFTDNQIPASIARDTEVATAVSNASAADRDRTNHTGTQPASTITGLATVATSGAYADLTGKPTPGAAAQFGARRTFDTNIACPAGQVTQLPMTSNVFDVGGYSTKVDGTSTTGCVVKTAGLHEVSVACNVLNGGAVTGALILYVNGVTAGEVGVPRLDDFRATGSLYLNLVVGDVVTLGLYVNAASSARSGDSNTSLALIRC